ncbi:MAG: hypothetical protein DI613_12695 [Kocuria rhizophila]|nr:MAG: hypothetical protein DI613_12695 [Kocuria rhizophila]
MPLTTSDTTTAPSRLNLLRGTILEGESRRDGDVVGCKYGIYRAAKNRSLIHQCVEVLNREGVVTLVPISASDDYLTTIAEQIEQFATTRSASTVAWEGGVLAVPTSGSTGAPKIVALPAAGITQFLDWGRNYFDFESATVSMSLSPWNFDVSLLDTWAVLAAGGTVVAAEAARLHDTAYLTRLLDQHRPTFIQAVPSTLDALINAAENAVYPSVKDIVLTGGVAAQPLRAAATRIFPAATFHNIYGATEVNDCLIETLQAEQFADTATLPLGKPITGCEIHLDTNGVGAPLQETTADMRGELFVRTPWMALGYITGGSITPLPLNDEGLYPTKDQVIWSDRQLMYQGRRDRMVKVRGQRVNLEEIEHSASRTSLVGMTCAWLEDSASTEELHLAYTSPAHSFAATGLKLRMAMSAYLPAFAMPNHLHAFTEPFPLNGNGKPDLPTIKSLVENE